MMATMWTTKFGFLYIIENGLEVLDTHPPRWLDVGVDSSMRPAPSITFVLSFFGREACMK